MKRGRPSLPKPQRFQDFREFSYRSLSQRAPIGELSKETGVRSLDGPCRRPLKKGLRHQKLVRSAVSHTPRELTSVVFVPAENGSSEVPDSGWFVRSGLGPDGPSD